MYHCILFDMDGTLVNSYEGIFQSYEYTFRELGLPFAGDLFVRDAIGRTLPFVFQTLCGMEPEQSLHAIKIYRDYYARKGQYGAQAYEGMEQTLRTLKKSGKFLGVATLKKEGFAREILARLGLAPLFDSICGMDENDSFSKAQLVDRCRLLSQAPKEETILVGDTLSDAEGAQQAGTAFLAVTYGFGLSRQEELLCSKARWVAHTPAQIAGFLCEEQK